MWNEIRSGVMPHAAFPQRRAAPAGNSAGAPGSEVDRPTLEVHGCLRRPSRVPSRTSFSLYPVERKPGDDVDFIAPPQAPVHCAEEVDNPEVHFARSPGVVQRRDLGSARNGRRVAIPRPVPVRADRDDVPGVGGMYSESLPRGSGGDGPPGKPRSEAPFPRRGTTPRPRRAFRDRPSFQSSYATIQQAL